MARNLALRALCGALGLALAASAGGFAKGDRSALTEVLASGRTHVVLLVLAEAGRSAELLPRIEALGAEVRWHAPDIDYLRLVVPLERAAQMGSIEGVAYVEADQHKYYWHAAGEMPRVTFSPPPGKDTPAINPYLPTHWLAAPQFMARHPTFDGRGVTVAVIDGTIDTTVPELQRALTLTGQKIPKIRDHRMAADPMDDPGLYGRLVYGFVRQPTWVSLDDEVLARNGVFALEGRTYRAPRDGRFRFGYFNERPIARPPAVGDVNGDGNPAGSSGLFAVLWDEQRNLAWVDVDQDADLAEEMPMADFSVKRDLNAFGFDQPRTPVDERKVFSLDIDPAHRRLNVMLLGSTHGTMVAGILAGHDYFGGAAQGMAPAAELIAISRHDGYLLHHILESAIVALRDPAADILQWSEAVYPQFADGGDICSRVLDRLLHRYPKPTLVAAGNQGPELTTVSSPSLAREAFSIGSFTPNETWQANFGVSPSGSYVLADSSGSGPADDGGLKPNLLTLSGTLATDTRHNGGNSSGFGPGYMIGGGTSSAAPFASGAVSLLLSAARQSQIPFDLFRLRRALMSSARFLPGVPAHRQGAGLLQVDKAWKLLVAMKHEIPPQVACEASVRTAASHRLRKPHRGSGFFEREGWKAGQKETREIICTRVTGPEQPMAFEANWLGNNGTFRSDRELTLPLRRPVKFSVQVAPESEGVHSALLQLRARESQIVAHEVLHTVVAARRFSAENSHTVAVESTVPRLESRSFFFDVPAGTRLFLVRLESSGDLLRMRFHPPSGKPLYRYPGSSDAGFAADAQRQMAFPDPPAGVWEVNVSNSSELWRHVAENDARVLHNSPIKLTASLVSVQVQADNLQGSGDAASLQLGNIQAPVLASAQSTDLGRLRRTAGDMSAGQSMQVHEVEVPQGASLLEVAVGPASASGQDFDLYLYDCSGTQPLLTRYVNDDSSTARITLANPKPGRWRAVVDRSGSSGGPARYQFSEVIQHRDYGHIEVNDTATNRASGAAWTVHAHAYRRSTPPSGWEEAGYIEVGAPKVLPGSPSSSPGLNETPLAVGRVLIHFSGSANANSIGR